MATKTTPKKSPKPKSEASKIYQFYLVVPGTDSIFHAAENALMRRIVQALKGGAK